MPFVGNDVVDLKEPGNIGQSANLRFLKKILTTAEIDCVQRAANPDAMLWCFWAAKETAYKVLSKRFDDVAFLPRRWPVFIASKQAGFVRGLVVAAGDHPIFFFCFSGDEYIHCVGSDDVNVLEKSIHRVEVLPENPTMDPSDYGRRCLMRALAEKVSLNGRSVAIRRMRQRGELQPPRLYVADRESSVDISLSHDGRWVAYTFAV